MGAQIPLHTTQARAGLPAVFIWSWSNMVVLFLATLFFLLFVWWVFRYVLYCWRVWWFRADASYYGQVAYRGDDVDQYGEYVPYAEDGEGYYTDAPVTNGYVDHMGGGGGADSFYSDTGVRYRGVAPVANVYDTRDY